MAIVPKTRLVLALDVRDETTALDIARAVKNYVDAIKINYPLIWACGPDIVQKIATFMPVICDLKIADIPYTNTLISEEAFKRGASAVIAHAFVGRDSLKACVDIAARYSGEVYAVVEMSHPGGKDMFIPIAETLCKMALECGVHGVIAPATRPKRIEFIRNIVGSHIKILSPGVGAQGGTAAEAIKNGADFVIVGRAIYNADEPEKAAKAIVNDIKNTIS